MRLLCMLLMWSWCVIHATAQNSTSVFRLPDKPRSHVSDESQWLSSEERQSWENQLETWSRADGVDIYLVILTDLYSTSPEYVTRQIADQWGKSDLHGVVLYVPGTSGPKMWWGGKVVEKINLEPRAQRAMIARMEKRAGSQISEKERVFAAIQELGDTMRVIHSQYRQMNAMRDKWNDTIYQNWSESRVSSRTNIIIVGCVALLTLAAAVWFASRIFHRTKKFHFPQTSPQRRFGATHAGGSGATTSLKS